MGFFSRPQPRGVQLPADIVPKLEAFGRSMALDSHEDYGLLEYELHQLAQADRDGLTEAVAGVARSAGGWATYGGSRAIWSVVDPDQEGLEHPAYRELLTEGLEFLQRSGVSSERLNVPERQHWVRVMDRPLW